MSDPKTFNVLSIDGGGIRGIIPAMVLAEIEKRAEKPICELFDLIAGTSTGGIIALALTRPKSRPNDQDSGQEGQDIVGPAYEAKHLVDLYRDEGATIFDRPVWHRIRSADGWAEEKYPTRGIRRVLRTYFGNFRLSEAITDVLIPSYDMQGTRPYWEKQTGEREGGHPRFFKSRKARDPSQPHEDYLMREVAHATAAAPTYFEPVETAFTPPADGNVQAERLIETLVDGGIFANNPAMCAYVEAEKIRKADERPNDKILLVSLGTGNLTEELDAADAKNWGKVSWINPLFTIIFDGASDTVNYQLTQLIDEGDYYRFQPDLLEEGNDEMDDAGETHLSALSRFAKDLITERQDELVGLSRRLVSNRPV